MHRAIKYQIIINYSVTQSLSVINVPFLQVYTAEAHALAGVLVRQL
jgi:hypothetical protein